MHSWLDAPLIGAYALIAVLLSVYGAHRWLMAGLFLRHRRDAPAPGPRPMVPVTVQLPTFNEKDVVERLIDAACELRWPELQIQVLDDSTDETTALAQAAVERWQARGVDIQLLHRRDRTGYKAGALQAAMDSARGRFIAIFDADFIPQPEFLESAMAHFHDDVGVVQARWGHINRDESLLCRLQAVLLDGHFVVEHTARNRTGRWFNFNGTAGIWRREAIADAGGWQHDTLTEDLDLSYRAQLAGWRFVYLVDLVVPAELPRTIDAFRSQQHRWAKGTTQTLLKLGRRVITSQLPWRVRSEALVHLSSNLAYPLVLLLALLNPVAVFLRGTWQRELLAFDLLVFFTASLGVAGFYTVSQWAGWPDWRRRLLDIPGAMALGIGLSVNQTIAVGEALRGHQSPFVRTPKGAYKADRARPVGELSLAVLHLCAMAFSAWNGWWESIPLQALFVWGFGYVAWGSLWKGSVTSKAPAPATSSADAAVASKPSAVNSSTLSQPATTSSKRSKRRASM
jgi:cellulose synthase/poly-beta-1,6-N-acetylglucosamine synthase-like glycosyltransferase